MRYDGPPILRDEARLLGLRVRSWVVAIGVVVTLVAAWRIDHLLAVFTWGLLVIYLGSKRRRRE